MQKCFNPDCNNQTTNPKFCSRSCAASHNNTIAPKRKGTKTCKSCGVSIRFNLTYCSNECKNLNFLDWNTCTLEQLKSERKNSYSATLRYISRNNYIRSGKELKCSICQYETYVEICHIKAIKYFPKETTLNVVSDLNNLVALCPNHHKEFDLGLLKL